MADLVAVTGANGFLGSHICEALLAAGHGVRAAHRDTSSLRWLRKLALETVETDLADPESLDRLLDGCTGVIHCAGVVMATEEEYQRVNVDTTRLLAEAAAVNGAVDSLVLISSLAAGGPAGLRKPRHEAMPDEPISGYGRSKKAAETVLFDREWPFRTVALRPPSLYGPRDREFGPLLRAAKRGWTARFGKLMQGLSLVHGVDAARAAVALLDTPATTGAYYVDDGTLPDEPSNIGRHHRWGYDWDELSDVLVTLFDRSVRTLSVPLGLLRTISKMSPPSVRRSSPVLNPDRLNDLDTKGWVCQATRLQTDTDWRPQYDLASGLRDTLDFYRRRGWMH